MSHYGRSRRLGLLCSSRATRESSGRVLYDVGKIWQDQLARRLSWSVKQEEYHCPLTNASYTNMLFDVDTIARGGRNILFRPPYESQARFIDTVHMKTSSLKS